MLSGGCCGQRRGGGGPSNFTQPFASGMHLTCKGVLVIWSFHFQPELNPHSRECHLLMHHLMHLMVHQQHTVVLACLQDLGWLQRAATFGIRWAAAADQRFLYPLATASQAVTWISVNPCFMFNQMHMSGHAHISDHPLLSIAQFHAHAGVLNECLLPSFILLRP